jgi:hypothetical protein
MNDKEARDRIIQTISTSKYRWRTPRGIAKDSGVPFSQVIDVLEHSDAFVRARKSNNRGEPLYSTKEKHKTEITFSQRVLAALTNQFTE